MSPQLIRTRKRAGMGDSFLDLSRQSVMIVDNNRHMRALLCSIFRALDIKNLREVGDGEEMEGGAAEGRAAERGLSHSSHSRTHSHWGFHTLLTTHRTRSSRERRHLTGAASLAQLDATSRAVSLLQGRVARGEA